MVFLNVFINFDCKNILPKFLKYLVGSENLVCCATVRIG